MLRVVDDKYIEVENYQGSLTGRWSLAKECEPGEKGKRRAIVQKHLISKVYARNFHLKWFPPKGSNKYHQYQEEM